MVSVHELSDAEADEDIVRDSDVREERSRFGLAKFVTISQSGNGTGQACCSESGTLRGLSARSRSCVRIAGVALTGDCWSTLYWVRDVPNTR